MHLTVIVDQDSIALNAGRGGSDGVLDALRVGTVQNHGDQGEQGDNLDAEAYRVVQIAENAGAHSGTFFLGMVALNVTQCTHSTVATIRYR